MSSGISKGIKKTFRSISKNPIKALPLAFAAAAVVFTAGSAMGALPTWGAAMGNLTSSFGMSPGMTSIISGALTTAGYGAAIGAAGSLVTGGDASTGATIGGATGAVVGGISGGLATQAPATGINTGTGTPTGVNPTGTSPITGAPATGIVTNPGAITSAPLAAPSGGMIDSSTQTMIGGLVSGLGQGLTAGQEAKDQAKALERRDRRQREWIQGNYQMDGGLLTPEDVPAEGSNPDPATRFSTDFYDDREFAWDPAAGKLVRKPKAA